MNHERMEENDIAHVASHLMKLATFLHNGGIEFILGLESTAPRNHIRGYAFGVIILQQLESCGPVTMCPKLIAYQMASNGFGSIDADHRTTCVLLDVCEKWDH